MRVTNVTKAAFEASVTFWAFRWSVDSYECAIKPLPILIEPPIQMPMGVFSIDGIHCVSMADDVLQFVVVVGGVAIVCVIILCAMQLLGYINLRAICGLSSESARFGELKANPYADPLPVKQP
jgi:hypothetical protein